MSETQVSEPKRAKVADHAFLDASGNVTKSIADAVSVVYTSAGTGETFSYAVPGNPGSIEHMLAVFGARTLAVNTASAARQARARGDADVGSDVAEIQSRFAEMAEGKWGEQRAAGEGAVRGINIPALVDAAEAVATKAHKPFDRAVVLQRLTEDKAYRRAVKAIPQIAIEYAKRTAGNAGKLDDVEFA